MPGPSCSGTLLPPLGSCRNLLVTCAQTENGSCLTKLIAGRDRVTVPYVNDPRPRVFVKLLADLCNREWQFCTRCC
jgi:hypothetical protein